MKLEEEKIMDEGKHFPSHFGEVYDAMPEKFEKRKDKVKPMIYWGLTAVCVLLVIFPGWLPFIPSWLPFIPSWLVRTAGIIGAVFCVLTALAAGLKIYNRTSGGEVKHYKTKKFISSMTDKDDIVAAFNHHDFEYLCDLPSGNGARTTYKRSPLPYLPLSPHTMWRKWHRLKPPSRIILPALEKSI